MTSCGTWVYRLQQSHLVCNVNFTISRVHGVFGSTLELKAQKFRSQIARNCQMKSTFQVKRFWQHLCRSFQRSFNTFKRISPTTIFRSFAMYWWTLWWFLFTASRRLTSWAQCRIHCWLHFMTACWTAWSCCRKKQFKAQRLWRRSFVQFSSSCWALVDSLARHLTVKTGRRTVNRTLSNGSAWTTFPSARKLWALLWDCINKQRVTSESLKDKSCTKSSKRCHCP